MSKNTEKPNRLISETSPYLQQHAYNPVDWYPWGQEALDRAKKEDKPIIVSIGYSACHWCHVMERESFENEQLAALMNQHYVCIKIDREERPDIDQIYMDAVHAMGVQGGWPLNVFLMPDQKPFYGGTYFPPQGWEQLLTKVNEAYNQHRGELVESAEKFTEALSANEAGRYGLSSESEITFGKKELEQMYNALESTFDPVKGGMNRAPKFPMPSIWLFLLRYAHICQNKDALKQVETTLEQMAWGGIYDQIGGGFSRYSVDDRWFAPHFEKMLYDNAQLITLFSEAFSLTSKEDYKKIVYQTIEFIERELTDPNGGFYAALDADSEGIEGKFYTWSEQELKSILKDDFSLIKEYYNTIEEGNWEESNILFKNISDENFQHKHSLNSVDWQNHLERVKNTLLAAREKRIRPGLDNKILTGWNGLMLKGLVDAYSVFNEAQFLNLALRNAQFIKSKLQNGKQLYRSYKKDGKFILAYLEDYAAVIQGYIGLYQVTFDESWLEESRKLIDYVISNFFDPTDSFFHFTDIEGEQLIARKKELFDNVIPGSNSIMASNLYTLGLMLDRQDYSDLSRKMFGLISKMVETGPRDLANWASLGLSMYKPTAEVIIVGPESEKFRKEILNKYHPNKIVMGTNTKSELPLLKGRIAIDGQTTVYVCYNKTCQLPVFSVEETIDLLKEQ